MRNFKSERYIPYFYSLLGSEGDYDRQPDCATTGPRGVGSDLGCDECWFGRDPYPRHWHREGVLARLAPSPARADLPKHWVAMTDRAPIPLALPYHYQ